MTERQQSKLIEVSSTHARPRSRPTIALTALERVPEIFVLAAIAEYRACDMAWICDPLTPLRAGTRVLPGKRTSSGSWGNFSRTGGRPTRPAVTPRLLTRGELVFPQGGFP
jgi:hypothetical protein